MSMQRPLPTDALQRIMTSFKHFEKKLDKLQDDVSVHGQTLIELRAMVTTLSGGAIISADTKSEDNRRPLGKTMAIQYEDKTRPDDPNRTKRMNAIQPLPTKLKAKSLQNQKSKSSPITSPFQVHVNKLDTSPKAIVPQYQRYRKVEIPRKGTSVRTQKKLEKKRSKLTK